MCKKNFLKFHLTVIIDLVEEAYYLKQVFHLILFKFHLSVKIDLVEVALYLKQVFHFLCDKVLRQGKEELLCLP